MFVLSLNLYFCQEYLGKSLAILKTSTYILWKSTSATTTGQRYLNMHYQVGKSVNEKIINTCSLQVPVAPVRTRTHTRHVTYYPVVGWCFARAAAAQLSLSLTLSRKQTHTFKFNVNFCMERATCDLYRSTTRWGKTSCRLISWFSMGCFYSEFAALAGSVRFSSRSN